MAVNAAQFNNKRGDLLTALQGFEGQPIDAIKNRLTAANDVRALVPHLQAPQLLEDLETLLNLPFNPQIQGQDNVLVEISDVLSFLNDNAGELFTGDDAKANKQRVTTVYEKAKERTTNALVNTETQKKSHEDADVVNAAIDKISTSKASAEKAISNIKNSSDTQQATQSLTELQASIRKNKKTYMDLVARESSEQRILQTAYRFNDNILETYRPLDDLTDRYSLLNVDQTLTQIDTAVARLSLLEELHKNTFKEGEKPLVYLEQLQENIQQQAQGDQDPLRAHPTLSQKTLANSCQKLIDALTNVEQNLMTNPALVLRELTDPGKNALYRLYRSSTKADTNTVLKLQKLLKTDADKFSLLYRRIFDASKLKDVNATLEFNAEQLGLNKTAEEPKPEEELSAFEAAAEHGTVTAIIDAPMAAAGPSMARIEEEESEDDTVEETNNGPTTAAQEKKAAQARPRSRRFSGDEQYDAVVKERDATPPIIHPSLIVDKKANLEVYPGIKEQVDADSQITIGDLHGNALKFLYTLVRHGVLEVSKENYEAVVEIYNTPINDVTQNQLDTFNRIIADATTNPVGNVRLIGDELADRGKCDYYTLKLMEKLSRSGTRFEILFSNHSAEFISGHQKATPEYKDTLGGRQAQSLPNLGELIRKGLVQQAEVNQITSHHYFPNVKAISYTIDRLNSDDPAITLYTHAPVGLETVKAAAQGYGIEYKDGTVDELCHTIDQINDAFSAEIQQPGFDLHKIAPLQIEGGRDLINNSDGYEDLDTYLMQKFIPPALFLARLSWNRGTNETTNDPYRELPKSQNGYRISLVHGHEGPVETNDLERTNAQEGTGYPGKSHAASMINIDANLGKTHERNPEQTQGTYIVAHSHETPSPKLSLTTAVYQKYGENEAADAVLDKIEQAPLQKELAEYLLQTREVEKTKKGFTGRVTGYHYNTFFGRAGGTAYSAEIKMSAAEKMLNALQGKDLSADFTAKEIKALGQGRLGNIVKAIPINDLPKAFTEAKAAQSCLPRFGGGSK